MRRLTVLLCVVMTAAGLFVEAARAQAQPPSGPVKILVPFAAGGPTDVIMRILGDFLGKRWSRTVIVENRPGAGTIVATAALAKSPPDGLTLGVAINAFVINPAINHALAYDTLKDFTGISMVVLQPIVLVAHPSFPANTVAEVVTTAKNSVPPLHYTSPGPRTSTHLAGEMLKQLAGISMEHVPYNGSAPALTDVIAGRVPLMFDIWHSSRPQIEAGKLKLIATTSDKRLPAAPDTPTVAETYPGFSVTSFIALIAPAGVPEVLARQMSDDVRDIVHSAEFAQKVEAFGVVPTSSTPEEFNAFAAREIERWRKIVAAANIKID